MTKVDALKLVMTSNISLPDIFKALKDKGLVPLIPVMTKVLNIYWVISAPSWSAEDSFSGLRRLKTYLTSTIGQSQLSTSEKSLMCLKRRKGRKDCVA